MPSAKEIREKSNEELLEEYRNEVMYHAGGPLGQAEEHRRRHEELGKEILERMNK